MEAFTFDTTEQILLAATGTLFIIQALYYLCLYNRIHLRSRAVKRGNVHFSQELPPVSVIICAREECENLRRNLKAVLGVKASKYDWLVFTEANCCPQSNQWLRLLARNFTSRTQVVLGYSGYERGKGWLHKRVAFDNLFTSMRYLGFALAGSPYMGIGRNLAYRKELFYEHKGFSAHLNLQRGDDDLFVNHVVTAENTRVETDADATVRMQPVFRAKDWREEKISYMGTAHFYQGIQRYLSGFETTTRLLFHAAWIAALVIGILNFHWLTAGIAFLMFALRYTMQALIINKTAKDLGEERRYFFTLPVFDILQPMQSLRWKLYCQFRKRSDFLRR
jgi:hypothetical protein